MPDTKLLHHVRQPKGSWTTCAKAAWRTPELRVHGAGVIGAQRQELEAVLLEASNFLCFSCAALFVTANGVLEVLLPEVGLWMCTSPSTNSSPMRVAHVVRWQGLDWRQQQPQSPHNLALVVVGSNRSPAGRANGSTTHCCSPLISRTCWLC
jgi:hypothetical protein